MKSETLNRLAVMLAGHPDTRSLGANAILIPSKVSSDAEAPHGFSELIVYRHIKRLVAAAIGEDLSEFYVDSCGGLYDCPLPGQLSASRLGVWIRKGWEWCSICSRIQTQFSPGAFVNRRFSRTVVPRACGECIANFSLQTPSSVRSWARTWYEWRADLILRGKDHIHGLSDGAGVFAAQLDAFDEYVAGTWLVREFGGKCAYCGAHIAVDSKAVKGACHSTIL